MSWFANLRLLVLIRRGVIALESLAESNRTLARHIYLREERVHNRVERRPRKTDFGRLDIRKAEERHRRETEEREKGYAST